MPDPIRLPRPNLFCRQAEREGGLSLYLENENSEWLDQRNNHLNCSHFHQNAGRAARWPQEHGRPERMIRSFIRYKLRMPKPCGGPLRLQGSGPWRSRLCGPEGGPGDFCATVAVDVRGRSIGAVERKGGGQGGPPDCAEIGLSRPVRGSSLPCGPEPDSCGSRPAGLEQSDRRRQPAGPRLSASCGKRPADMPGSREMPPAAQGSAAD